MGWRVKVTGDWKLKVTFANGTVSSRAANQFAFSVSSIKEDSIVNTVSSTVQCKRCHCELLLQLAGEFGSMDGRKGTVTGTSVASSM